MKTSIPPKIRKQINQDPYFRGCALCGKSPVQIHHHLIFGGKQQNEIWSLFPLCIPHHKDADKKEVRSQLNQMMRERAGDEIKKYEKVKKFI